MRREQELVDGDDASDAVAAVDEDAHVAGAGGRIARHHHHRLDLGLGQRLGLGLGPGARRIEHDGIVAAKLLRPEWAAEQVADGGAERLQLRRRPRRLGERRHRRLVLFVSIDLGAGREREGEGAETGEQISDALSAPRALPHQSDEHVLRRARGLEKGAWRQPNARA